MIDALLVNGNAAVPFGDNEIEGLAERSVHIHRNDIEPRHHDLAHGRLAKFKNAGDHLLLVLFDHPLAFTYMDEKAQAVFTQKDAFRGHFVGVPPRKGGQPAEQERERRQPAAARFTPRATANATASGCRSAQPRPTI